MPDRRDIEARLLAGLGAEERAGQRDVAALLADAAPRERYKGARRKGGPRWFDG